MAESSVAGSRPRESKFRAEATPESAAARLSVDATGHTVTGAAIRPSSPLTSLFATFSFDRSDTKQQIPARNTATPHHSAIWEGFARIKLRDIEFAGTQQSSHVKLFIRFCSTALPAQPKRGPLDVTPL
jgi:hypothetical protein